VNVVPFLEALSVATTNDEIIRARVGLATMQLYASMVAQDTPIERVVTMAERLHGELEEVGRITPPDVALRRVLEALPYWAPPAGPVLGRHAVHLALIRYGEALFKALEPATGIEVLTRTAIDAELAGDLSAAAQARLIAGFALRARAEWDASWEMYVRAQELAGEAGEHEIAIRARIGQGNNMLLRGDLPGARTHLRAVATRARRLCPEILWRVLLAQANVENLGGNFDLAIALAYRALSVSDPTPEGQYPALVDLAHFFTDYGAPEVAREALTAVATIAPEANIRVQAQLNLLYLAVQQADRPGFDAAARVLVHSRKTVHQQALIELFLAQGHRTFGELAEARAACERALRAAGENALHQISFQAEEERQRIDAAIREGTPDRATAPVEARTTLPPRMRRIAAAVVATARSAVAADAMAPPSAGAGAA